MSDEKGRYAVMSKIGRGGMAEVYLAEAAGPQGFMKRVALKRMRTTLSADPDFATMFVNEARIASNMSHPNIVQVLDFDRTNKDELFLVMELIEGHDLSKLMKTGLLPASITAFVMGEVLKGLTYAHELSPRGRALGIVHRDVSPQNVLVSFEGAVKLADFGIAKAVAQSEASKTGVIKGKMGYLSPEQIRGERLDGRSDQFSAGVMMHELLTGASLFKGGTAGADAETLGRVLSQPIYAPSRVNKGAPKQLDDVCMRMLDRDPARRFANCNDALMALLDSGVYPADGARQLVALMHTRFSKPQREAAMNEFEDPTVAGYQPPPNTQPTSASVAEEQMNISMHAGRSGQEQAEWSSEWSSGRKLALGILLLAVIISAGLISAALLMGPDVPVIGPFPEIVGGEP